MTKSISQRKFHDFPKKYDQYASAKPAFYFALGENNIDGEFICSC